MSYNKILVDCERMKYPNTGLYHFCLQLGLALTQQLNNHIEHLDFYVRKNEIGIFGSQVGYISQHSLHKYLMPKQKVLISGILLIKALNTFLFGKI